MSFVGFSSSLPLCSLAYWQTNETFQPTICNFVLFQFTADRTTNGRANATVCVRVSVCLLSVTYVLWLNGAS